MKALTSGDDAPSPPSLRASLSSSAMSSSISSSAASSPASPVSLDCYRQQSQHSPPLYHVCRKLQLDDNHDAAVKEQNQIVRTCANNPEVDVASHHRDPQLHHHLQADDKVDDECFPLEIDYMEDGTGVLSLPRERLQGLDTGELEVMSDSLGGAVANHQLHVLEIHAVPGLNWYNILRRNGSRDDNFMVDVENNIAGLRQLSVRFWCRQAVRDFATALCCCSHFTRQSTLWRIELEYDTEDVAAKPVTDAFLERRLLFQGLKYVTEVVLRCGGNIMLLPLLPEDDTPPKDSTSSILPPTTTTTSLYNNTGCNHILWWEFLSLENCPMDEAFEIANVASLIGACLHSLEELSITRCQISVELLQALSDKYVDFSTQQKQRKTNRQSSRPSIQKNPLQVLRLSENDWTPPTNGSSPSCAVALATWIDSLSKLVELDLSHNTNLFRNPSIPSASKMEDLCGTVHYSLRQLNLRNCGLTPTDLHHVASTFGFLEGLNVSENPLLMQDLSPLLDLQGTLQELVMENTGRDQAECNRYGCNSPTSVMVNDLDIPTDYKVESYNGQFEKTESTLTSKPTTG